MTTVYESECMGTEAGEFVALLNEYLVVKVGSVYQLCKFDASAPTSSINAKVLSAPTVGVTSIFKFSPYFVSAAE